MQKLTYRIFLAACIGLCWSAALAQSADVDPQTWLLEQVRFGEATFRDDIVRGALDRLYRISPGNILGREAELRLFIRRGEVQQAEKLLQEIKQAAPGSEAYRRSRLLVDLARPEGSQALQQARLLSLAGRIDEALVAYEEIFQGILPSLELEVEYWQLSSRLPGGRAPALAALLQLDKEYPRNIPLRQTLASLLFAEDRDDEALSVLFGFAEEPSERNRAAQRVLDFLLEQPVDARNGVRWSTFMQVFGGTPAQVGAQQEYARRQQKLDDPDWQSGLRGLALLEQDENVKAELELERALQKYPNESELLGGLGLVYNRTNRREKALIYFERARAQEQNLFHTSKWTDLMQSTRAWLLLQQADDAMQASQMDTAQKLYKQAAEYNDTRMYALIGQGDVALASAETAMAERYYLQARRMEPADMAPLRALVDLYRRESPEKALSYLDSLPSTQRAQFAELYSRLALNQSKAQGDSALADQDWSRAAELLTRAQQLDPDDPWLAYRLAQTEQQLGRGDGADAAFARLLARQGQNPTARYAHALFLASRDQDDEALESLQAVDRSLWSDDMRALVERLERNRLNARADAAEADQDWARATELLAQAQQLDPDDPWLAYRLAQTEQRLGQGDRADAAFARLLARQGQNPTARYAHALFLASRDQDDLALESLQALDRSLWNDDMRALGERLERQHQLAHAERLRTAGHEAEAIAFLGRQVVDIEINLLLADWAQQRGDYVEARAIYAQVLALDASNVDAILGQVETWIALGDIDHARSILQTQLPEVPPGEVNKRRRLANAWAAVGNTSEAKRIINDSIAQAGVDKSLLYRDAARLLRVEEPQQALDYYASAMRGTGLLHAAEAQPRNDEAFTLATRANDSDDWLRRSIRADADELYRQQNTTVTLHRDFWSRNDGSPGTSDSDSSSTILQVDMPYRKGQLFVRVEQVSLDVGQFDTDSEGFYDDLFGTCAINSCNSGISQHTDGTGLAAGWGDARNQIDIGVTPMGFDVEDVVGGFSRSGDLGSFGWTLGASRRAMSNSLLSYAGTRDPNTGITWGGVRATGINAGLGWDRGGPNGFWSDLGYHFLDGKNVEDNRRWRLMAGYYRRLINRANQRLTMGLTGMIWHYDKDLSEYTLGHGGYYSPQRYYSLSLPVGYTQRTQNWSFLVQVSLSWSSSRTDSSLLYPLPGLLPADDQASSDDSTSASTSSGSGYSAVLLVERRLTKHMVLGAGIDVQEAEDFKPRRGMLYLRYTMQPWAGNLPLPPEPLRPYSDF